MQGINYAEPSGGIAKEDFLGPMNGQCCEYSEDFVTEKPISTAMEGPRIEDAAQDQEMTDRDR